MNKAELVQSIINYPKQFIPRNEQSQSFASANIALCKYWGKKNILLNTSSTNSISLPLNGKGAEVTISKGGVTHHIILNGTRVSSNTSWGAKLIDFMTLFLPSNNTYLTINIKLNIPPACGLASSSCIYAALIKSLAKFYNWNISDKYLSILARIGSGSAARSVFENHFVELFSGDQEDSLDSYAQVINLDYTNFRNLKIALIILSDKKKTLSSSDAMQISTTSCFYEPWIKQNIEDYNNLKNYLYRGSFLAMAQIAESNSLRLHGLMLSSKPSIIYSNPETLEIIKKIWHLRNNLQIPIFFTQDAGANIKILYEAISENIITKYFTTAEKIKIFA